MQFEPISHLKEMMRIRGISTHFLSPPYSDAVNFDDGLHHLLYGDYDFISFIQVMIQRCQIGTVYLANDKFELNYILIKTSADELIIIGPYAIHPNELLFNMVCEQNDIPVTRLSDMKKFFYGIPFVERSEVLESEIILIAKYILDNNDYTIERIDLPFYLSEQNNKIKELSDSKRPLAIIEALYQNEDNYLEAVERGDLKQATLYMSMFNKFTIEQRHADSLRDLKNYCFVLNTLLRKAVQRAAVHPAYIHELSAEFAVKIEAARTREELSVNITQSMLRKYCLLVNNHSLKNYSLPVRKAVNYIDFNFSELITLEMIAESAAVNYSYLSSQFKKETGSSVVDYINRNRIQRAFTLLISTSLSINAIAEKCGFSDDAYFTRVFKKVHGKSPREYRKSFFLQK
ncbi:MAG: AraC family transcriptional regulator [Oscillospiraceae bacterium]|nr:AraC family transcriptional regulator [Oscillospiraceae bacterium]